MAPKPCAKYEYVVTPAGPKILTVTEAHSKHEESPADYNPGGYLPVKVRDTFKDGRYTVLRKLGWGHFSTVWLVKDHHTNRHSALKVVKSAGRYAETARDEIKLLRHVMDANPAHPGRDHVVSFLDAFNHQPSPQSLAAFTDHPRSSGSGTSSSSAPDVHVCIVFEPLGENLLALIERHKATGVPPALVKVITKQVLRGLQYLHEECELVHTDIKPENIMIAIPDVESHIQVELTVSPTPTSRKVGVPPKQTTRSGVAIPRRGAGANGGTGMASERHMQIFDSQPLVSPPGSASWKSRSLFAGLAKMREAENKAKSKGISVDTAAKNVNVVAKGKGKAKEGTESEDSDVSSGPSSVAVSSSAATSCTPPTSIGSVTSAFEKLAMMSPVDEKGKGKLTDVDAKEGEAETAVDRCTCACTRDQKSNAAGPSLLSQTAPQALSQHSPLCPTHARLVASPASLTATPASLATSPEPLSSPSSPSQPQSQSQVHSPLPNTCATSSVSTPSSPTPTPATLPPLPISVKIADLGNATPLARHYTEDIQTRQYRAPEAVLGRTDWGARADVWSLACVVFELLTAEYLFDPQSQGELFGKDDDHCAQIIELVGAWPREVLWGGRYSREIFDANGNLRYIRNLKPWPLQRVMTEKYGWSEADAASLCEFLLPMLRIDHRVRAHAREMVDHPWLEVSAEELDKVEW